MNNFIIEKIDPLNLRQAKEFVSWYKDPVIINNWLLQREEKTDVQFEIEDFQRQFTPKKDSPKKHAFMLKVVDKYVGYGQFYINHPVAVTKKGRVCWPSVAVGNEAYRGQGFGVEICKEIQKMAKSLDCSHIEAGVFEFNDKIKNLLLANKFKFIGKQEIKTYLI